MPRILLYTDQPILATGLRAVLGSVQGCELVSICTNAAAIVERVADAQADIVLLDLTPDITFGLLSDLRRAVSACKIAFRRCAGSLWGWVWF